jgi:hypothetical protein
MDENLEIREDWEDAMTDQDIATYLKLFPVSPRNGCTFTLALIFWIPLALILYWATDSWIPGACAAILPVIGYFVGTQKAKSQMAKTLQDIPQKKVRVVEGIVRDYMKSGLADYASPGKATHQIVIGETVFGVFADQLLLMRYGTLVRIRYLAEKGICLNFNILDYRGHSLDWQAPVTPSVEEEQVIALSDFNQANRSYAGGRVISGFALVIWTGFAVFLGWMLYLGFGWNAGHWVLGGIWALVIAISAWVGRNMRKPQEQMLKSGRKNVVIGTLSSRMPSGMPAQPESGNWDIGGKTYPLWLKDFVLAEPGDRVKLHYEPDSSYPFLVERLWTYMEEQ